MEERRVSLIIFITAIITTAIVVGGIMYYMAAPPAAIVEPVKIGVMLDLTGSLGPMGEGIIKGVETAVFEINQYGGINGRDLELIIEDTATDPSKAAEIGKKLIEVNKVPVIIGPMSSGCFEAISGMANEGKVVLLSGSATAPGITHDFEYAFRVVGSDDLQGKAFADIASERGYERAATMVMNNPYGIGLEEVFKREFDGEIVEEVKYELGKADYRGELEVIKAADPDVIVLVAYPEDGSIILKQSNELGMEKPWIAAEGIADRVMLEYGPAVIEEMERMLLTHPSKEGPAYDHFLDVYHQLYPDEDPHIYASYYYDAVHMAAMAAAYGDDGEGVRDALPLIGHHYMGASGDKIFDEYGEVMQDYEIMTVKDGEMIVIGTWKGVVEFKDYSTRLIYFQPIITYAGGWNKTYRG
jgi:ABC-type branched-subunit amino acid transport system substrate-binding protein